MAAPYYNRRLRKSGNLKSLKAKVWRVVIALEKALEDASDAEQLARLSYAQINACREYRSLFESTELEKRLDLVEAALKVQADAISVN